MTSRQPDSGLDGILLVDKPAGWTSHDVVARARRLTGQRRIGHTGTLDPFATGLLVLCLGRATRLVEYLAGHDKRYTGIVALGRTTTTDDADGETLSRAPVPTIGPEALERATSAFRGPLFQQPPAFSALKVAGRRAYDIARKGGDPALAPRPVTIHALTARLVARDRVEIDVTCSAGTYIRSLARDLGGALGCGGHLAVLRRHSAGHLSLEDAASLEALERAAQTGAIEELLLQPDDAILDFDAALLAAPGARVVAQGGAWQTEQRAERSADPCRIYADSGEFVGIGTVTSSGEIRASKVFLRTKSAK